MAAVIFGITAMAWSVSAEREVRTKMPEKGRFYPSRWYVLWRIEPCLKLGTDTLCFRWSKQIIEHEKAIKSQSLENLKD